MRKSQMNSPEFQDLYRKFNSFQIDKSDFNLDGRINTIKNSLTNFHLKKISENKFVKSQFITFLVLRNKLLENHYSFWCSISSLLEKMNNDTLFTLNERNQIFSSIVDKYLKKG